MTTERFRDLIASVSHSTPSFIHTKGGRRLAFSLAANEIGPLSSIADVLPVFQDQGKVAAILWKLH